MLDYDTPATISKHFYNNIVIRAHVHSENGTIWLVGADPGLLKKCPVPNILNLPADFKEYCDILMNNESDFIVTKKNAGEIQENIKIPAEYRNKLNQYMSVFFNEENYDFTCIHQNHFF